MRLQIDMFLPNDNSTIWTDYTGDPDPLFAAAERFTGVSREEIMGGLNQGMKVRIDRGTNSCFMRSGDFYQQKKSTATEHQTTVTCDCGHTVAANLVMTTANGTSCPNCYDKMSE